MKIKSFSMLVLVTSLVIVSALTVSAQGPGPTATPARRMAIQPPPEEPSSTHNLQTETLPFSKGDSPASTMTAALPKARSKAAPRNPSVAVGQFGFSFRYAQTFGIAEQAYTTDNQHLNAPSGLFIDGSNNVYVVEDKGYRVLKFNSSGSNVLTLGTAGLCYTDNYVFCTPQDVALDSSGNIWVADGGNRVVEYNSSGTLQQTLPATSSWQSGADNTHFSWVTGIAFDNVAGRMFVSDSNNHRIQVYTFGGSTPVHNATIGVTGVSGGDNSHFNQPRRLGVDSSGRLYVVDTNNGRVQRCSLSGTWGCVTFTSGLNYPEGIGLDSLGNVFIADTRNSKIRKCDTGGGCADFITGFPGWTHDVAIDSSGNVYVSNWDHGVIRKYSNSGTYLGNFVGTTDVPYFVDAIRINTPWGIAVASDGSIYVAENNGHRLIKMNAAGIRQWTVGTAGVQGYDNTHFHFPQGSLALDAVGRVYVPDQWEERIQVYNSDGSFYATFGSYGTGNNQFGCTAGVFINPANGDIYVVDRCNQRIQVYTSGWSYKATLGTTGVAGSDGTHFNNPQGLWVDKSGNIYVADGNNHRIQKCILSGSTGTCTTFIGQTGISGFDFDYLGSPLALAMDSAGRLYVVDQWNNRVQVFDASGAYLTTIGGSWGMNTGQLRSPSGIAIDSLGNVYITDRTNSRIQKFAIGVPGWWQANINGFGTPQNTGVYALAPFGGQLYAGTYNSNQGAQLWRTNDGTSWTSVMSGGFGSTSNAGVDHLLEFNGQLYASTEVDTGTGGEVWRSSNGLNWTRVVNQGFGDPINSEVFRLAILNDTLYASTWVSGTTHGTEIWGTTTGNAGDWTRVIANGFNGDVNNSVTLSFESFNGYLYAGTRNVVTGAELWRTNNGTSWAQVNTDGFGSANNTGISSLASFNGYLYAGTRGASDVTGAQVWRCQNCDGTDWVPVLNNGLNVGYRHLNALQVFAGDLYFVVGNGTTGMQVWRTANGTAWEQVGFAGFGDSSNRAPYWDNPVLVFNKRLYVGTLNSGNGGEVWSTASLGYLPMIVRSP